MVRIHNPSPGCVPLCSMTSFSSGDTSSQAYSWPYVSGVDLPVKTMENLFRYRGVKARHPFPNLVVSRSEAANVSGGVRALAVKRSQSGRFLERSSRLMCGHINASLSFSVQLAIGDPAGYSRFLQIARSGR